MNKRLTGKVAVAAAGVTVAVVLGGCATMRLTRRESVDVLTDALNRFGYAKDELAIVSTFKVTYDRFSFHATNYEVAEETVVHPSGTKTQTPRRGKVISDRSVDILWSDISRVYVKKQNRIGRIGEVGEFVVFEFRRPDRLGHWATDSFAIGEIVPGINAPRDLSYDLVVAVRTLSGSMLEASRPRYRGDSYRWPRDAGERDLPTTRFPASAPILAPAPDPVPTPVPVAPETSSRERELQDLKRLYDSGLITDAVYKERQLQILNRP